jgi:hypothetical protein
MMMMMMMIVIIIIINTRSISRSLQYFSKQLKRQLKQPSPTQYTISLNFIIVGLLHRNELYASIDIL